jgi:hypothetical protein
MPQRVLSANTFAESFSANQRDRSTTRKNRNVAALSPVVYDDDGHAVQLGFPPSNPSLSAFSRTQGDQRSPCTGSRLSLVAHREEIGGRDLVAQFDSGRVTCVGRALLVKEVEDRFRFVEQFGSCFTDHHAPELIEYPLTHRCHTGGAGRSWLRGLSKLRKRYSIHAAARSLGMVMRKQFGCGKPRTFQPEGKPSRLVQFSELIVVTVLTAFRIEASRGRRAPFDFRRAATAI